MTTKEKILDAALMLFSEKGYDGVGVDLIAETVGLKGPSLYRHFKGKEAILNGLLDLFEQYYEDCYGEAEQEKEPPSSLDELIEEGLERIEAMIHDEKLVKMRKLLSVEQFRNERLKVLATRHHLAGMEELYTVIFDGMMENGLLKEDDPRLLAFQFVSPIILMIHLYDRELTSEEVVMDRIQMHMEQFVKMYGVEETE